MKTCIEVKKNVSRKLKNDVLKIRKTGIRKFSGSATSTAVTLAKYMPLILFGCVTKGK